MTQSFTPPELNKTAFHCPRCNAYANQRWGAALATFQSGGQHMSDGSFSLCLHCSNYAFWHKENLIFPSRTIAPRANIDLPEDIIKDYEEASSILGNSPRGAAALLRLCIQKLCKHLGEPGKNINDDIAQLVKKGLNPIIQKSLDVVRVVGNEAVHPGTIDLTDQPQTAIALFNLVNLIADSMITQPKMVNALYDALPEDKKEFIAKRDK
jgi:hypothetical protein